MSWLDDNLDLSEIYECENERNNKLDYLLSLDTDIIMMALPAIIIKTMDNKYTDLVISILKQYKNKNYISDKQKRSICIYILHNEIY